MPPVTRDEAIKFQEGMLWGRLCAAEQALTQANECLRTLEDMDEAKPMTREQVAGHVHNPQITERINLIADLAVSIQRKTQ